jgi:hypothetical protein
MVRPDLSGFKTTLSVDWVRGFIVRIDELLDTDFILIRNDLSWQAKKLFERQIDTFNSENIVFQAWLCGLNENEGVKTVSNGRVLRLLEIVDRKAFATAVESFVSAHSWRPEFIAANSQRQWSNEADVSGYAGSLAANEIDFEGIYTLHALSLHRADKGLKAEIWWEELRHEDANNQRFMFFHLVDQSGKILRNLQIPLKYAPPFDNLRWRYGSVTFGNPLPKEATALAIGIFRPTKELQNNEFLKPGKGVRDWGGIRVLVPIPVSAS